MTKIEDSPRPLQRVLLSSNRLVFAVVCVTTIGVILETGIIRVSGFQAMADVSSDVKIFVRLDILCIFTINYFEFCT